jgi:hypothetical protein
LLIFLAIFSILKIAFIIYKDNLYVCKDIFSLFYTKLLLLCISLFFLILSFKRSKKSFFKNILIKIIICGICIITDSLVGLNAFNELIFLPCYKMFCEPENTAFLIKLSIGSIGLFIVSFLINCKYLSQIILLKEQKVKLEKELYDYHCKVSEERGLFEAQLVSKVEANKNAFEEEVFGKLQDATNLINEKNNEIIILEDILKNESQKLLRSNESNITESNITELNTEIKILIFQYKNQIEDFQKALKEKDMEINNLNEKINFKSELEMKKNYFENLIKEKDSIIESSTKLLFEKNLEIQKLNKIFESKSNLEIYKNLAQRYESQIEDLKQYIIKHEKESAIYKEKLQKLKIIDNDLQEDFENYITFSLELKTSEAKDLIIIPNTYKDLFNNISNMLENYINSTFKDFGTKFIYIFTRFCSFFMFDEEESSNINEDSKVNKESSNINEDSKVNKEFLKINEESSNINEDSKVNKEFLKINEESSNINEDSKVNKEFLKINEESSNINEDSKINEESSNINEDSKVNKEFLKINEESSNINEDSKINEESSNINEDSKVNKEFLKINEESSNINEDSKVNEEFLKINEESSNINEDSKVNEELILICEIEEELHDNN